MWFESAVAHHLQSLLARPDRLLPSHTGWVANLRADGEATVTHPGGRRVPVQAIELSPDEAGAVLRRALQPRVLRALLGRHFRPPIGVLWRLRIRIHDALEYGLG